MVIVKTYIVWFVFPFLLALSACAGKGKQSPADASGAESSGSGQDVIQTNRDGVQTNSDQKSDFPFPDIPITLASQEERLQYLFTHYWDEYDFTDTARLYQGNTTEQALVNYFYLLEATDTKEATENLRDLVKKMKTNALVEEWFREKMEHYLYEPNSPMRNDDFYRVVLEAMLAGGSPGDITLERLRFQLKTLRKNMKGTKAANFSFKTAGGEKTSLWKLKSNYTLLLLYDPDCSNCHHVIETLAGDARLTNMCSTLENGMPELTILTIAVEGDEDRWFDHLPSLPADWLNGYDEGAVIQERELYDLRSVPSMYLLDRNKQVLVRDANAPEILEYLMHIANGTMHTTGY